MLLKTLDNHGVSLSVAGIAVYAFVGDAYGMNVETLSQKVLISVFDLM